MIRFDGVGLHYTLPFGAPGPEVLRDLTFTLEAGSFTWLLGHSGAGKSSLLAMMRAALRPSRGTAEVLGVDLGRARRRELPRLRRRIGTVFQDFRLLPHLSVYDNVALPLRIAGRRPPQVAADVTEMLRWVGLGGREADMPAMLSGGECQRVALARAVIARPALLLADEPTGALDAPQARRVLALLQEMHRLGTTVVVATHSDALLEAFPAPALELREGELLHHG